MSRRVNVYLGSAPLFFATHAWVIPTVWNLRSQYLRGNSLKPLLEIKLMSENQMTQQGERCDILIGPVFHQKIIQSLKVPSTGLDDAGSHPASPSHACSLISMCNAGCDKGSFPLQVWNRRSPELGDEKFFLCRTTSAWLKLCGVLGHTVQLPASWYALSDHSGSFAVANTSILKQIAFLA